MESGKNCGINDNKEKDAGREEKFSLYTEKIVLSPKVKYRKLFTVLKLLATGVIMFVAGATFSLFVFPMLMSQVKDNEADKQKEVIIIQKDPYEYVDDQYSDDSDLMSEEDLKEKYETAMTTLFSKVESVQKNIVLVDTKHNEKTFPVIQGDTLEDIDTASAGLVVAHANSKYIILASYDVVKDGYEIVVKLSSGRSVDAELIYEEKTTGVALISISDSDFSVEEKRAISVASLDNSYRVRQGDMVIGAGRIYGRSNSIDYGIISGMSLLYGKDNAYGIFDTNITGMKGDYVFFFNSDGNVVGISYYKEGQNIKFLGISDFKADIESIINSGGVMYCGITAQNVSDELSEKYGMPKGVYVSQVDIDSPAFAAGLQSGDVIVKIDDKDILTVQELHEKLYKCEEGDAFFVTVKRLGKDEYTEVTFSVTVRLNKE